MDKKELWEKAVAFHGHICGGVTIGYKAALYAIELLDIRFSPDEELVCIAENDACRIEHVISEETFDAIKNKMKASEETKTI